MARKPSNMPLIIVAVAAGAALVGVNAMQLNSDPLIREKKAKEAEQLAAKKQAEQAKNNPQPQIPSTGSGYGSNEVASWGEDKTFGQPGGKPSVTIAWEWTPALQGNPSSLYAAVDAVKKTFPTASVRVVNIDANPGTFKPGISVDGSLRESVIADGTFPQPGAIVASLKSVNPAPNK